MSKALSTAVWSPPVGIAPDKAGSLVCSFLDVATTSFGRATAYNTREQQQEAELAAHNALIGMERDLYSIFLMLPGVTERAQQLGTKNLLASQRNGQGTFLDAGLEREILYYMMKGLRPNQMIKAMEAFKVSNEELGIERANNARSRKLTLRILFNSSNLQWWAVKYRKRLRRVLRHVWGQKIYGAIRAILARHDTTWSPKEYSIIKHNILRFAENQNIPYLQCVKFILGLHDRLGSEVPLFKAFRDAKTDLTAGKRLPPEVLEGIRSTYHSDVPHAKVLEMTAKSGSVTTGQRMKMQREAQNAGVKLDVDLSKYDAVKLYIYAFERGMTQEIAKLLDDKARQAAGSFPTRYDSIGIIVDASASMAGHKTQAMRPIAGTLAMRDMLKHTAQTSHVAYVGGFEKSDMVRPAGDTDLSEALVDTLQTAQTEAIFVLSDGYENAPAGRFAETVDALREMGNQTPVYHLNPVFAAEASGVRSLSDKVPVMPVRDPNGLSSTFIRGMIEAEPIRGINTLIGMARSKVPALLQ